MHFLKTLSKRIGNVFNSTPMDPIRVQAVLVPRRFVSVGVSSPLLIKTLYKRLGDVFNSTPISPINIIIIVIPDVLQTCYIRRIFGNTSPGRVPDVLQTNTRIGRHRHQNQWFTGLPPCLVKCLHPPYLGAYIVNTYIKISTSNDHENYTYLRELKLSGLTYIMIYFHLAL